MIRSYTMGSCTCLSGVRHIFSVESHLHFQTWDGHGRASAQKTGFLYGASFRALYAIGFLGAGLAVSPCVLAQQGQADQAISVGEESGVREAPAPQTELPQTATPQAETPQIVTSQTDALQAGIPQTDVLQNDAPQNDDGSAIIPDAPGTDAAPLDTTPPGVTPPDAARTGGDVPSLPADMPSLAPVSEDEFGLDLDENMEIGVAWPDMNSAAPDVRLTGPVEGMPGMEDAPQPEDGDKAIQAGVLAKGEGGAGQGETPAEDSAASEMAGEMAGVEEEERATADLADDGSERRYKVVLNGLDEIGNGQFYERFNGFSVLKAEDGKPANLAQINRRMQLDADLIDRILRAKGYYNAFIRQAVLPPRQDDKDRLRVTFTIRPGTQYMLSHISLPGLGHAAARVPKLATIFPVKVGDPVDADAIRTGQKDLATALLENGYPFSRVEDPEVIIDHETQKGDLEMVVRAGGYRVFGGIELDGEVSDIFTPRHLMRIARFDEGDVYQASDVEDLRQAIVATGLVSSVDVRTRDAGDGTHANLLVSASAAPMRTIAGEIGYGTGEGYRIEASWQHRNFFPPEGAVTVQGLVGTREQAAGVAFRRNNFRRRDNVLSTSVSFRHRDFDAYKARTLGFTANIERQSNLLFHKKWAWSAGVELLGSRERNYYGEAERRNRNYLIGALPMSLIYDASDDLLDPTTGFRLGARISPEISWQDGTFTYVRSQVDGSAYVPLSEKLVIASRVRAGSIIGGIDSDRIAPSRRFYAGGGASVRGYAYQAIGPRDPSNDPVGGKSLMEFSLEARIRMGIFGVVPFVDAGNISTGFLPKFSDVRYGAGVGLRYYSPFGPIRIDVGTPLNRQRGDSRIAVYVSLGQSF